MYLTNICCYYCYYRSVVPLSIHSVTHSLIHPFTRQTFFELLSYFLRIGGKRGRHKDEQDLVLPMRNYTTSPQCSGSWTHKQVIPVGWEQSCNRFGQASGAPGGRRPCKAPNSSTTSLLPKAFQRLPASRAHASSSRWHNLFLGPRGGTSCWLCASYSPLDQYSQKVAQGTSGIKLTWDACLKPKFPTSSPDLWNGGSGEDVGSER